MPDTNASYTITVQDGRYPRNVSYYTTEDGISSDDSSQQDLIEGAFCDNCGAQRRAEYLLETLGKLLACGTPACPLYRMRKLSH